MPGCLIAEASINVMRQEPPEKCEDYECVEALLDSGAGECVCGPQHFVAVALVVDPARPTANVEYVTADGGRLPNLGEKKVAGISTGGLDMNIKFQVTHVDKPLIAVSRLTAAGHKVELGGDTGSIVNKANGNVTTFIRKNGVYMLQIWAKRPPSTAAIRPSAPLSGGSRQ